MGNLYLREANIGDMDLLFKWANDSTTRNNAFSSEQIPYDVHKKWYEEVLCNSQKVQLILVDEDNPVGQVRIDIDGEFGVIDYSIAPEMRGKGYGKAICELMVDYVKTRGLVSKLVAQVKSQNVASEKCFESCGFAPSFKQYELELKK